MLEDVDWIVAQSRIPDIDFAVSTTRSNVGGNATVWPKQSISTYFINPLKNKLT